MDVRVHLPGKIQHQHIAITGSKSEANRLLLLKALYPEISIANISASDDSEVMQKALVSTEDVIDVHHAGTAMRFLTAYFSLQEDREVMLTGSARMKERPIGILVDALRSLGADIMYAEKEGYPPLKIKGKKLQGGKISIPANISSQYITALLLIGSSLEKGLELVLEGEITSLPYIQMTLGFLKEVGIKTKFESDTIAVLPQSKIENLKSEIAVESDWSSASYFYSIVALSEIGTSVSLSNYKSDSLQGDAELSHIYKRFGVHTEFEDHRIILSKTRNPQPATLELNLNSTPDIAQTIAVTCFGLGVGCHLTGLHTLKIKETDRLSALKTELERLGASVEITDDSLTLQSPSNFERLNEAGSPSEGRGEAGPIDTYNDHRMALAFAPLAMKMPLIINDAGVVSKSYPAFWDDLQMLGFVVENN